MKQASPTSESVSLARALERFLEGIETGDWDGVEQHLAPDVVYDASVPGWHYQYQGASRVAQEYRQEWTGRHTWTVIERHVSATPDGAVIEFEARGRCPGTEDHPPHEEGIRIANIFRLEDGRIAEHRLYCCGEWDEDTLQRIAAEAPKVNRKGTPP